MFKYRSYPQAADPTKVGTYKLNAYSGGGYFYDEVLEYRVWAKQDGELPCCSFSTFKDAQSFSKKTKGAEPPLVLVMQNEYIAEPTPGHFKHVKKKRITEWQVDWLKGTQGTHENIPSFMEEHR